MTATDTHRAIDAVFRIERAKLIAGLTRIVRDVGVAEELAQDALVAALTQWTVSGIPDKPGAWLMAVAKQRATDLFRRSKLTERKHEEFGYALESSKKWRSRISMPRSTTLSATISSSSFSSPAIRFCPPRRAPHSRCACSAA